MGEAFASYPLHLSWGLERTEIGRSTAARPLIPLRLFYRKEKFQQARSGQQYCFIVVQALEAPCFSSQQHLGTLAQTSPKVETSCNPKPTESRPPLRWQDSKHPKPSATGNEELPLKKSASKLPCSCIQTNIDKAMPWHLAAGSDRENSHRQAQNPAQPTAS